MIESIQSSIHKVVGGLGAWCGTRKRLRTESTLGLVSISLDCFWVVDADNPSLVMSAILSLIGQLALLCRQIPDVVSCLSGCTASLRSLPRRRAVGQRHIIAERNQMHQTPPPFPRQVIMRFNGDRLFQNVHDCALRNMRYQEVVTVDGAWRSVLRRN